MSNIDIHLLREKIVREVEQWKEKTANHYTIEAEARWSEANYILGILDSLYLDTLESEKPVPADLEEAAGEYADKHGFRVPYDGSNNFYDDVDVKASKEGFINGAKWQKGQMMKEAVEGHIVSRNDGWNSIELPSTFFGELSKKYKDGDKVHIIIVKED